MRGVEVGDPVSFVPHATGGFVMVTPMPGEGEDLAGDGRRGRRPDWATTPARHFPGPDRVVRVPEGNVLDYWTPEGVKVEPDECGQIVVPAGVDVLLSRCRGDGPPPPVASWVRPGGRRGDAAGV